MGPLTPPCRSAYYISTGLSKFINPKGAGVGVASCISSLTLLNCFLILKIEFNLGATPVSEGRGVGVALLTD